MPFNPDPFGTRPHDHRRCQRQALARALGVCQSHGARLTPLRRRVLELVWRSHVPVKAYDLLERLKPDYPSAAPTTVYRALGFLLEQQLIHRLQSVNAFIGCRAAGEAHHGQFLICRHCGAVAELADTEPALQIGKQADELGFRVENETIEISGTCAQCQDHQP